MIEKRHILASMFPSDGMSVPLEYVPKWPAIDKAIDSLVTAMNSEPPAECDCCCKCGHVSCTPINEICAPETSLPPDALEPKSAPKGEPDKPPGVAATYAPTESTPPSKIPSDEDEWIYVMHHVEGKTFAAIAKSLNGRGISCVGPDVSNRYYKTQHEISKKRRDDTIAATLSSLPPAPDPSKLSIEDARILQMANEGCMVHEICVYARRNFHINYSTFEMAKKIRNLQAGKDA